MATDHMYIYWKLGDWGIVMSHSCVQAGGKAKLGGRARGD